MAESALVRETTQWKSANMASLRDYFDTDFSRCVRLQTGLVPRLAGRAAGVPTGEVAFVTVWDEAANARWPIFFVPKDLVSIELCIHLVDRCEALHHEAWNGVRAAGGTAEWGDYDQVDSENLKDSRQVYLYLEGDLSDADRTRLLEYGVRRSRIVRLREPKWARMRDERDKPVLFISHDSRDKDDVARPLARALTTAMCPVWFDE